MRYLLTIVTIALLTRSALAADAPKKDLTRAEQIYKALNERKDLDVKAQPLSRALDALTGLTDVRFTIDPVFFPLGQAGPGGGIEFEIALRGQKAGIGAILNRALAPHGYTWVVLTDHVLITSFERSVSLQMHQKITLDLNGETLARVLNDLSRQSGANIVLDPQAAKEGETKVNLRLQSAGLEGAVQILASGAGLQAVRQDNVLYVTTPTKVKGILRQMMPTPFPSPWGSMGLFGLWGGAVGFGGGAGALGGGAGALGGGAGALGGGVAGFGGALGVLGAGGGAPAPRKAPKKPMGSSALQFGGISGFGGGVGGGAPAPKKTPNTPMSFSSPSRPGMARLVMAAPVGKLLADQTGLKTVVVDNVRFVTTVARTTEMRDDPDFKRKPELVFGGMLEVIPGLKGIAGGKVLPPGPALPRGGPNVAAPMK